MFWMVRWSIKWFERQDGPLNSLKGKADVPLNGKLDGPSNGSKGKVDVPLNDKLDGLLNGSKDWMVY